MKLKKTLATVGIAGFLILGGASAADAADRYPPTVQCTVTPASIPTGGTATIRCTGFDLPTAIFSVPAGAGTLSSIVQAAAGGSSVQKPVAGGVASATFTAPGTAGTYIVSVSQTDGTITEAVGQVSVTVTAASGGGGGLPATGGTIPAAAIWLGVGAVGVGAIAVAAAVARRRAGVKR